MTVRLRPGAPEPLGVTLAQDGANIAVVSRDARAIELCLFDAHDVETARLPLREKLGDVWFGFVEGLREGQRYGLRAHGDFAPERGLRFDARKLLVDPYACELDRPFALHPAQFSHGEGAGLDSAPFMPKAIARRLVPAPARATLRKPWRDAIVYELNVKGFTARLEAVPEQDRGAFRGLAHPAAVAHLKSLGVTVVELMPSMAWIDERHLPPLGLTNVWGYNPVAFLAPDPRRAPGGWSDVQAAVSALRAAGIETILDVVLNHSGESDDLGPTLSLRGLDNAQYYRLRADDPARYDNDAGCGNVLDLDRPAPLRLALDALRAWATYGGVDGFRFDLATTLARRSDGFDPHAPFLAAIAQDPQLRDLRLIAEPWDIGPGGYRPGAFPAGWGEWNDAFRDTARRFWRGDTGLVGEMATRLAGSQDRFAQKRPSRSVNFVTAHDGFTLADLVAYERKRNDANGEDNRDGTDANCSWNNGVEGPSDDPDIRAARRADQRALLATLLLSRGTPMLSMGDEIGHGQGGNNNAYAQDNATTQLDWAHADAALFAAARRLVGLRKAHPALTRDAFLEGGPLDDSLVPDVQWLAPDGAPLRDAQWGEARALIACLYAPAEDGRPADRALLALNPTREAIALAPPAPREGHAWTRAFDSADPDAEGEAEEATTLAPRSVLLLVESAAPATKTSRGADPELLARLAAAAGLAPDWSEIDGTHHVVSEATQRALLAGMRLPCATQGEARDSLVRLADEFDRRPLPYARALRAGAPGRLRLPLAGARPRILTLGSEAGDSRELPLAGATPVHWRARDGRRVEGLEVAVPALAPGRWRAIRDDAPEAPCALLAAPPAHLPDLLRARAAGVSAQLYAVRREGDRGVGDFSTLAELARRAGAAGLATVAINPLHALFPGAPDRASPYHPSDRRFLDPLYVDVDALAPILGFDPGAGPPAPDEAALIDYARLRADKGAALARAHLAFVARRRLAPEAPAQRDFARFVAEGGVALWRFACFEAIAARRPGQDWRAWPSALARGEADALAAFARDHAQAVEAALFQQWLADRQLDAAAQAGRASGLGLGLMRDLAVGAAPDGAESWATQDRLVAGASIGAPPDPFAENGQIWTLPPPDPLAGRRDGEGALRALLEANMRHAGALRIDHVMGLARLFVVPDGANAREGAYLAFPFAERLAEAALASARAGCTLVGEDLGTVPEGFRERLAEADVLSWRVLWFEREGPRFVPPACWPDKAVACVSTHDLPTLIGWWEALDIEEKARLGLLAAEDADAARNARAADRRAFLAALREAGALDLGADPDGPWDERLGEAASRYVAMTPAALALAQLDDLAGERVAVNLPGTDRERPNWRRRLSASLETALSPERLAALLRRG